jgi:hypothetical protein
MVLRTATRTLAISALLACGALRAQAQIPEKFKNLQVFPKETSHAQLMRIMEGFADALGVECGHCHAGGNPDTLQGVDFASDDKWEKRTARAMLRMTTALNDDYISRLESRPVPSGETVLPPLRVECVTCHRSVTRPETIGAVLSRVLDRQGPEAALRTYKDLREKFLDQGSYDFSNGPLNTIAEDLLKAHRWRDALPLLEYTVASHPNQSSSLYWLGEARLAGGDRSKALEAFEQSLALEPENEQARKRVGELRKPASPKH